MTDTNEEPMFKELDGNTLFMSSQFWESETTGMRFSTGVWAWEDVSSIEHLAEDQWPEVSPRCAVKWQGGYLYLNVPFDIVLKSWRAYRLRYGAKHLTWTTQN